MDIMNQIATDISRSSRRSKPINIGYIIAFIAISIFLTSGISAQDGKKVQELQKIQEEKHHAEKLGFIDEDGDGFNDLLPDSDGDGIPDLIDPDFRKHPAESLYMEKYNGEQIMESERNIMRHQQHGEPGQFGPDDSTGHGQHDRQMNHGGNHDDQNMDNEQMRNGQNGNEGQTGQ